MARARCAEPFLGSPQCPSLFCNSRFSCVDSLMSSLSIQEVTFRFQTIFSCFFLFFLLFLVALLQGSLFPSKGKSAQALAKHCPGEERAPELDFNPLAGPFFSLGLGGGRGWGACPLVWEKRAIGTRDAGNETWHDPRFFPP